MNSRKSSGPRTVPCGAPLITGMRFDVSPSTNQYLLCPVFEESLYPAIGRSFDAIVSLNLPDTPNISKTEYYMECGGNGIKKNKLKR